MAKRTGHYVVSTHWDREWYETFQDYRFRLVRLLDEALDQMKTDESFRYFQVDGQSIPVEDYLTVRPEREEEIRELAAAGRFRLGPWYVLPDEFLVSGESLVRNLQMGLRVASQYGPPSRAGFVCDLFGHVSQLPQIFHGFGIDSALLWRGTNESTHGAMFRWQSPDGSEVIAYRFSPRGGYCSYAFKVRKGDQPDEPVDLKSAMAGLGELLEFETERCPTDAFLVFDGGDHMEIEPQTAAILARAKRKFNQVELVHSHLDGFIEEVREQRDRITRTFVGELRDPGEVGDDAWVIPGVLSSRIRLKQANANCETELCRWAEPFSTFAAPAGRPYPRSYLDLAWQYLLRNHAHDSICGCSIDQVHRDMQYRFDQSHAIASRQTHDALEHLVDHVRLPEVGEKDLALIVFNPSADAIDGPVDLTLRFPSDLDAVYQEWFGFEPKIGFRLYDPDGEELPYQYVNQRRERQGYRRPLRKFPTPDVRHEVDVTVPLEVPPFGYTTIVCRPVKEPTRHLGSMVVDDHTIENENLRVSVGSSGGSSVLDKRSGETYDGLLTLEDRADIGDGWYHGMAVNDQVFSSIASSADVAVTADGIAKATLMIRVTLEVPEAFDFGPLFKRSDRRGPLEVTHHVTLRRGGDDVEVRTEVDNTILDHRLRVLFPTGAETDVYLADQAFDVVQRPIALRADNARYKEMEVETKPQQTWTAVHDDRRGLAVVATGLPESAVRDVEDLPIALTLLRSIRRTVMTSDEPGGQIQGRHAFDYRIVPLAGPPDAAKLIRLGQRLAAGVRTVQRDHRDVFGHHAPDPTQRDQAARRSFLEVDSARVVVTAVHRLTDDEAATLRMFNPTDEPIDVKVALPGVKAKARLTDLEGRPGDPLPSAKGGTRVRLEPKQIVTIQWVT